MSKNQTAGLVFFITFTCLGYGDKVKVNKADADKFEVGDVIEFLKDGPTLIANHTGWINNENTNACVLMISYFKEDNVTYTKQPLRILREKKSGKGNRTFTIRSAEVEFIPSGWVDEDGKKVYSPNIHYKLVDTNDKFNEILCRPKTSSQMTPKEADVESKTIGKYLDKVGAVRAIFKGQALNIYKMVDPVEEKKNSPALTLDEKGPPEKAPTPKEKPRIDL